MQNSESNDIRPTNQASSDDVQGWFYRKENTQRMFLGLAIASVLIVLSDLLYENEHPHFELEKFFGFQAWLGFIAFVVIVFLGRLLRIVVGRPESYYD